jgi:hypothetical protein
VFESGARGVAFALIAFALWRVLGGANSAGAQRVLGSSLARDLPSIEAARTAALHVQIDAPPAPADRDALAAVAHAGTRVKWSGAAMPPLAAVATRERAPGAPVRISVASGTTVSLADGLASLDSVNAAGAARGSTVDVGAPSGTLSARSGAVVAGVGVPAAGPLHAVLIVGRAGWEGKFVAAALEEQGWTVEERLFIAPGADVTQGAITAIDTSRFSAIVAIDTVLGATGPAIARFVHDGGGLVLLADAANASAVRSIAPARAGTRRAADSRAFDVANPVNAMAVYPLETLRGDAVRLSTRGSIVTSAARREGAGRVLQASFDETWRWRMQGGADAVAAHRAWWSRMVASVAATPMPAAGDNSSAESAPVARLVEALGPASAVEPPSTPARRLPVWLFPVLLVCLLGEWASRRLRGAQ